jgi:hypothetical protein
MIELDGVATLSSITCVNNVLMTDTEINASTTTATADVAFGGVNVATLSINGASSTAESYGSRVVPPTDNTVSSGTNPKQSGTDCNAIQVSP